MNQVVPDPSHTRPRRALLYRATLLTLLAASLPAAPTPAKTRP